MNKYLQKLWMFLTSVAGRVSTFMFWLFVLGISVLWWTPVKAAVTIAQLTWVYNTAWEQGSSFAMWWMSSSSPFFVFFALTLWLAMLWAIISWIVYIKRKTLG